GVPAALAAPTVKAAAVAAAGRAAAAGVVPARVAALTEGVVKAMQTRFQTVTVVLLVAGAVGAGVGTGGALHRAGPAARAAADDRKPRPAGPPAAGGKAPGEKDSIARAHLEALHRFLLKQAKPVHDFLFALHRVGQKPADA